MDPCCLLLLQPPGDPWGSCAQGGTRRLPLVWDSREAGQRAGSQQRSVRKSWLTWLVLAEFCLFGISLVENLSVEELAEFVTSLSMLLEEGLQVWSRGCRARANCFSRAMQWAWTWTAQHRAPGTLHWDPGGLLQGTGVAETVPEITMKSSQFLARLEYFTLKMPELNGQISKQQTQKITPNFMLQFNSILWDICVCALTGPKMPVLVLSCKYPRRMVFTVCLYDIVPPLPLFLSRVFFLYLPIYL